MRRELQPLSQRPLADVGNPGPVGARLRVEPEAVLGQRLERRVRARPAVAVAEKDEDIGALGGDPDLRPRRPRRHELDDVVGVAPRLGRDRVAVGAVVRVEPADRSHDDDDLRARGPGSGGICSTGEGTSERAGEDSGHDQDAPPGAEPSNHTWPPCNGWCRGRVRRVTLAATRHREESRIAVARQALEIGVSGALEGPRGAAARAFGVALDGPSGSRGRCPPTLVRAGLSRSWTAKRKESGRGRCRRGPCRRARGGTRPCPPARSPRRDCRRCAGCPSRRRSCQQ